MNRVIKKKILQLCDLLMLETLCSGWCEFAWNELSDATIFHW